MNTMQKCKACDMAQYIKDNPGKAVKLVAYAHTCGKKEIAYENVVLKDLFEAHQDINYIIKNCPCVVCLRANEVLQNME